MKTQLLFLSLLVSCQANPESSISRATKAVSPSDVLMQAPAKEVVTANVLPKPSSEDNPQIHYVDTLRPHPLSITYWTSTQLDSMRAVFAADTASLYYLVPLWTDRCRVLREEGRSYLRLFYRPSGQPMRWVEVDLEAWQEKNIDLLCINPCSISLASLTADALLVRIEGGNFAQGIREKVSYTLVLLFERSPQVIWQSLDYRWEEIPPTGTNAQGEMMGGNYAEYDRKVEVRNGLIYVSQIKKTGAFESSGPQLTPIAPGYYWYHLGRFSWVKR